MHEQEANKTVDAFVTALHALAEHCNYGKLYDDLIRDRIVVRLVNMRISERMQKVINKARQFKEIKKQQNTPRNNVSGV